jgi:hypothetical protein
MQLLDDDMDELFRKAASQYPLKTDGSDWDAVMSRLPQSSGKAPSSGFKWLSWLWRPLLTLLIIGTCAPVMKTGDLILKKNGVSAVALNTNTKKDNIITTGEKDSTVSIKKDSIVSYKTSTISNNNVATHVIVSKTISVGSVHITGLTLSGKENGTSSSLSLYKLPTASLNEKRISAEPGPPQLIRLGGAEQNFRITDVATPLVPVQKGFYAGIVASPDISTVKLQKVNKVGYNAGIIAGYRFSRHVAVETGVLLERKNYYSEGKYLSTKNIPIPADMKIINVDGWCNMLEIPLNVRYVFNIKNRSNWYVNGGLSSYIMSKESYAYKYETYGNVYTKSWDYKNATRNWFSIIHVGVGYEHRLGAVGTLRVEPYLKIPAGGIGIGNLPITSVGLNVGITRSIRF